MPKDREDSLNFLIRQLPSNMLFAEFTGEQLHVVAGAMQPQEVEAEQELIKQGDEGDAFYVVESGTFDIIVGKDIVGVATRGQSFGELSLIKKEKRAATVRAVGPSKV